MFILINTTNAPFRIRKSAWVQGFGVLMELLTDMALIALATFMALGWIIWLSARSKQLPGLDKAMGVQKVHVRSTSRLGGLGVLLGLACGLSLNHALGSVHLLPLDSSVYNAVPHAALYAPLLVCALPVFLAGLFEDLTHQISPRVRFVMGLVSASSAWVVIGVQVNRVGVWPIDVVLVWSGVSYAVTMLVVVGFTHAMNIIDGFHGLAASQVAFMCSAMAYLCARGAQIELMTLNLVMLAVSIGFMCWNWPLGKIFLGDAGAYLMGFWVVSLGLLWVQMDPKVSPMAPVLLGAYPLIETLWSMYRRVLSRKKLVASPDGLHLHSLIYRRLWWMAVQSPRHMKTIVVGEEGQRALQVSNASNARVSPFFCCVFLVLDGFVMVFYQDTNTLLLGLILFVMSYIWLFKCLIRFKTPALLRRYSEMRKRKVRDQVLSCG